MTKVTYLFGAGASANALPVVNELPQRINELVDHWIKGENRNRNLLLPENEFFEGFPNRSKRKFQNQLLSEMKWVAEAVKRTSVDNFAKKLFVKRKQGAEELKKLKIALSMFFILEQARVVADVRYDKFFASILAEDALYLPETVRILSWNYDYQLEKTYSEYCGSYELPKIQELLNVISKGTSNVSPEGFAVIKLNSTTSFTEKNGNRIEALHNITVKLEEDSNTIDYLTNYYAHFVENDCEPSLSFAWEDENSNGKNIVDKAID